MPGEWFYNKNGQQLGPVTIEQLKELAASGQLLPSDMVFRQGMGHWTKAGIVKGIFGARAEAAPVAAAVEAPPIPAEAHQDIAAGAATQAAAVASVNADQMSATGARASRVLDGFPASTGSKEEWPLAPHQLAQLQQAEQHRKPIRALAGLFRALFLIAVVTGVVLLGGMAWLGMGNPRDRADAIYLLIPVSVCAALSVLFFLAGRSTMKCQSWGSFVMIVLSMFLIVSYIMALTNTTNPDMQSLESKLAGGTLFILPAAFLVVAIRAYLAFSKFLESPVWCQEALVSSKL